MNENAQLKRAYDANIVNLDRRDPVWRVFRYDRLLANIRARENVLVPPAQWDDPFENFMGQIQAHSVRTGTTISLSGLFAAYYGQCWTSAAKETDMTWRIYAPAKDGARVRSRVGKLFDSIWDWNDNFSVLRCFIGRVEYCSEQDIRDFIERQGAAAAFDANGVSQARTLLIKRLEFEHEHEVRLLYNLIDREQALGKPVRSFPCDPNHLFEEIVLDPRLGAAQVAAWQRELYAAGYTGHINQSPLYKVPNLPTIRVDF